MNLEQQQKSVQDFQKQQTDILFKKGNDYANEDRLSNFKLAGNICGNSAAINCLNLIGTKVARLGVLLSIKKVPNNESIKDSILDLANYATLLNCILEDSEKLND